MPIVNLGRVKGTDGKSAYQSYLDTTTDDPALSEAEWAIGSGGNAGALILTAPGGGRYAVTVNNAGVLGTSLMDEPTLDLITNLVAHWKLDEADGPRYDSHGTYHLTDNNQVGQTTGVIGNAADFDGSNYLASMTNPIGESATAVSISAWLKPVLTFAWMEFVGTWGGGPRYLIGVQSGIVKALINTGAGDSLTAGADIATDEAWHHAVMTFDGVVAGGTLSIYVDGTLVDAVTGCGNGIVDGPDPFYIANEGVNSPCVGAVDSVSIWNRAITPAEVTALYNSGDGLDYPFE
jgi:hypothetical protein